MPKRGKNPLEKRPETEAGNPLERVSNSGLVRSRKPLVHVFAAGHRCATDERGHQTPGNRGPLDLVLEASEGFIPLWKENTILRWRFKASSFSQFAKPEAAKGFVRKLIGKSLMLWGDAAPVRFAEREDAWDFEVVVKDNDDCDASGCTLASAFFPDQGRHQLIIYPKCFEQTETEQIETLAHEFGHVFGLRHFFATIDEARWRSEIFGEHRPFSIMNYGVNSVMTDNDRSDLKTLYQGVWRGEIKQINGTPIRLVKPYHET